MTICHRVPLNGLHSLKYVDQDANLHALMGLVRTGRGNDGPLKIFSW